MERVGGIIEVKIDGELYSAKGAWTYNLGVAKRDMVVGSDGVHGYKEMPQAPKVSGVITDSSEISLETLLKIKDATLTLSLANGKIVVMREAVFTGSGDVTTEEGEIAAEFGGKSAEEVR
jgi:hypothetical protein